MIQPESPIQVLGPPPAGPGPAAAGGGDVERKGGGLCGQQAVLTCAQARGFHDRHSSCEGLVHMKRSEWEERLHGHQLSGLTEEAGFSCVCVCTHTRLHMHGVLQIVY